jgi:hypothetical protein
MATTYKSAGAAAADKVCLGHLHAALNAANSAMRRDDYSLWTIQGSRGYAATWGDGQTWMLAINSVAPRRWTFIKQNLAVFSGLAQVTQDGDTEGVIRLMRLPAPNEATEIRHVVGIRQTSTTTPIGRRFTRAKTGDRGASIRFDAPPGPDPTTSGKPTTYPLDAPQALIG